MPDTRRASRLLALGAAVTAAVVALLRRLRRHGHPDEVEAGTGGGEGHAHRPPLTVELLHHSTPYLGDASVVLRDASGEQRLKAVGGGRYRGVVRPGEARLVVSVAEAGLVVPERRLHVGRGGTWRVAVLGADQPFLRLGNAVVPIRARTDLLSVAFIGPRPRGASQRFTKAVSSTFGWRRIDPDSGEAGDFNFDDDALVAFRTDLDDANTAEHAATLQRLAVEAGFRPEQVRTGFLIEGDRRQRAMLDGEFIVAFNPDLAPDGVDGPANGQDGNGNGNGNGNANANASAGTAAGEGPAGPDVGQGPAGPGAGQDVPQRVKELLGEVRASVVQPVRGLPATYLVRFEDRDHKRHLATAERLVAAGMVSYFEPNLAARLRDCFSLTDYRANRSANLDRMNAEAGWTTALAAVAPAVPVKIGTLDRGVDTTTTFIDSLTVLDSGGNPVVNQVPENNGHGMSVASIASGNGLSGCWGAAPFLAHVAIQRTSTTDVRYWDAFDLGFLPQQVSVVSISHESEWLCADSASQLKVTNYVNGGLVIVVAAGNDSRRLDELPGDPDPTLVRGDVPFGGNNMVANPLAVHPHTITVGNTMLNSKPAETFWSVSSVEGTNRGDYVDLCAFGHNITAFGAAGAAPFTGTSAAAPLVAGTIGLMRHVNPSLTVGQIRAILASTADPVQPTDGQWLTLLATWASPGADWDPTVAPVPKHNLRYGFGRVNIGNAVAKAAALKPVP